MNFFYLKSWWKQFYNRTMVLDEIKNKIGDESIAFATSFNSNFELIERKRG